MNIFVISALALGLGSFAFGSTLPTNSVTPGVSLSWTYPTNKITCGLGFNIYDATDITTPWEQWPIAASVAATNFAPYQATFDGTNWVATNLTVRLDIQPGAYFFVATASNFWGETSITSNVVSTPPAPLAINDSLRIRKVP